MTPSRQRCGPGSPARRPDRPHEGPKPSGGFAITTAHPDAATRASATQPGPVPSGTPSGGSARSTRISWGASVRDALDRPLTTYYLLVGAVALLLTIGLVMVLSASSVYAYERLGDSYAIIRRQMIWVVLGVPAAWLASRVSPRFIRSLAYPAFSISLLLLGATAIFGVERNGNTNWLALGPIQIQPSEIAKLSLIIWAAHIYANKERRLDRLHELLVPVVPGMVMATALVVVGRDLGTALVFFAILIGMLWVVGAPGRLFFIALMVVGSIALALAATDTERLTRIANFADPFKDYHGAGWQPAHGLYAMASGGIAGEGIGASQQKWGQLPEAHTDFIFAVLGEELGLIGTLLVISLFLVIAYAIIRVARQTTDPFIRYASFGVAVWLLGQMIINVGMVLALLPVIGIPLPLVSYGGSSLVPALAALGMVIGFARREPAAARALAQRRRARSAGLSARR
ncbi:putative lipid II flippase FtsW [Nocardioides sambongensis]|uniref:putative lipid II flippase FtsW n=1 Tax=Nocardioides sambongensis TaxID=2589074 RepID=UPI001E6300E7|nr:putative lipid II flippase FtsW [Nocardioides sambongensis]